MRRKDREIQDRAEVIEVMRRCEVCNVAMLDGDAPYVVPMNFGILGADGATALCFHCASEGKKLTLLRRNPKAAFAMSRGHRLEMTDANRCTMRYESVCGTGRIREAGPAEKVAALEAIMAQYRPGMACRFEEKLVERTTILILEIETLTGKRSAQ